MDFLGKFKFLWFLSLCLLTEARNIHRREAESARDLETLRTPQKYIIEPVQQVLTKLTDNSVAVPYDPVDFGVEDKLNEIESKNENSNIDLVKELDVKTEAEFSDKSTQTREQVEIKLESTQLKETSNEENLIQTENEQKQDFIPNIIENDIMTSKTDSKINESNDEMGLAVSNQDDDKNQIDFINEDIKMDSENVENVNFLRTSLIANSENEQLISTTENSSQDKEPEIVPIKENLLNDREKDALNFEKITPSEMVESEDKTNIKEKETTGSEKPTTTQLENSIDIEKETIDNELIIPVKENNVTDEENETSPVKVEITEDKKELLDSENIVTTNDKEKNSEEIASTKDKDKELTNSGIITPTEENNIKNSENKEEIHNSEWSTASGPDSEKVSNNLNTNSLQNADNKLNPEEISKPGIMSNKTKPLEHSIQVNETTNKISTTEKTATEINSAETSINSNKDTTLPPNIKVTTEAAVTDLMATTSNQTISETILTNQTYNTTSTSAKLPEPPKPTISSNPIIPSISASPITTTTTTIKPLTESPIVLTTKPAVSFITTRPTRPSRLPTRRPIIPIRRPSTTRRPSSTNPGWFSNFPILPNAPLLPTFFINPFNTTTSSTNQTQSTFGFGIFAVPWNWRPNFTNFFGPNRLIETRPPLNDSPQPAAESRDLAFWNALFHRGYTNDGGANKQTNAKVNETKTENATPSYWKPWNYITSSEFLKFPKFSNNKNASTEQATIPANTQVLHLYFPLKYPFQGQIVQTPGKRLNAEVITATVAGKIDAVPKARKSLVEVKEPVEAVTVKFTESDLVVKSANEESAPVESAVKADSNDKENVNRLKGPEKGSLMLELELPKPVAHFVKGVMDTFMTQQN